MANEISYRKKNDDIECVHYKNWTKSYPPHTHAEHLTLGIVEDGSVCIVMDGAPKIYRKGDEFRIPPNVLHEIKPVDENGYSMLVTCARTKAGEGELGGLKDSILDQPENLYLIEEMSLKKKKASARRLMTRAFATKATWTDAFKKLSALPQKNTRTRQGRTRIPNTRPGKTWRKGKVLPGPR